MKHKLPEFTPELRVVARGVGSNRLMVMFDTATDADHKRAPRLVTINTEGIDSLTPSVENIAVADTIADRQYVSGQIYLVANMAANTTDADGSKYLLSDFKLKLSAAGRADKNGQFAFPSLFDVEQLVRQGVADAFTEAGLDLAATQVPQVTPEPAYTAVQAPMAPAWGGQPLAYAGMPQQRQHAGATSSFSRKRMLMLMVGIPLALLLTVWAFFKIITPADPVQAAVANALRNDPQARDEQIEITRQTLKEMGLDPGKSGDLGCLAPPQ